MSEMNETTTEAMVEDSDLLSELLTNSGLTMEEIIEEKVESIVLDITDRIEVAMLEVGLDITGYNTDRVLEAIRRNLREHLPAAAVARRQTSADVAGVDLKALDARIQAWRKENGLVGADWVIANTDITDDELMAIWDFNVLPRINVPDDVLQVPEHLDRLNFIVDIVGDQYQQNYVPDAIRSLTYEQRIEMERYLTFPPERAAEFLGLSLDKVLLFHTIGRLPHSESRSMQGQTQFSLSFSLSALRTLKRELEYENPFYSFEDEEDKEEATPF